MELKRFTGIQEAEKLLDRSDPLDMGALPSSVLSRTESVFGKGITPEESVMVMLQDIQREGEDAVRRYVSLLDGNVPENFEVSQSEIDSARESISKELEQALLLAAERVTQFHQSTLPKSWVDLEKGLGELVRPLERVGLYAPGGTASYPSTVLMTAIPAKVAGVKEVVLCTPKVGSSTINPAVLAAAQIAGVDVVYQVGGVPAIAAMAYGTATVPKVDKICGPGNFFVSYAKQMVRGQVDIDGIFGPTETIVLADQSANAAFCAADLIAQAEHDPLATAILITNSSRLISDVEEALDDQLKELSRKELAQDALLNRGKVVLLDNLEDALDLANKIAPEHLCLMVEDPWTWAGKVKNAGGLFLGEFSPEVMGDYVAGPSHVMPTGGTARFNSALGVHQFLRTMPVVGLNKNDFGALGEAAVQMAHAEGLTGHSGAIKIRLDQLSGQR